MTNHPLLLKFTLIITLVSSLAFGNEKKTPPKDINETPFDKRASLSQYSEKATSDQLVFPTQYHKRPGTPYFIKTGDAFLPLPQKDPAKLIWKTVPLTKQHHDYLKKRKELMSLKDNKTLINWCLKNNLNTCAEYELQRNLLRIWSFQKKEYKPYMKQWLPLAKKDQINFSFSLPLKGEWYVVIDKSKHHQLKAGAAFAFDMVKKEKGKETSKKYKSLKSYRKLKTADFYSWAQEIIAQADGIVIQAEDKNKDNKIGATLNYNSANYVTVYYGAGISGFYGHLKQGSLKVTVGQKVKQGQILALVGNSGASGSPHLHFSMISPSGLSLKGRFNFQVKSGKKWKTIHHEDLPEGKYIKNIPE